MDISWPEWEVLALSAVAFAVQTRSMLGTNGLTFADEVTSDLRDLARDDPERPMSVLRLVVTLLGTEPRSVPMVNTGELVPFEDRFVINTQAGLPEAQLSFVYGHELCHYWHQRMGAAEPPYIEELCDAVGARLATPDLQFAAAVHHWGHRVHTLARKFHTTQAIALLRVSELTGRPGMVKRQEKWIARGADFEWADNWREIPRAKAHYVRVDDRWGMLAIE